MSNAADWLRYSNQGATRNLPVAPELVDALSFLPELGVTAEVFSGGQPGKGSGGRRVGSTRHDHGGAGDFRFYDANTGRLLNWADEADRPLFEEIVHRGRERGITGIGAGDGYMSEGSMHLGFGAPAVWGAGGSSANAPDWLQAAYNGAEAPPYEERQLDMGGATMAAYPSTLRSILGDMPAEQPRQEGFGGFLNSSEGGSFLQALGMSLMSSPRNAPLSGMAEILPGMQDRAQKRELLKEAKDKENRTLAWLAQNRPDLAGMVGSGMSLTEAAALARTEQEASRETKGASATADWLEAQGADEALVEMARAGQGGEAVKIWQKSSGTGSDVSYGMTPIPVRRADGSIGYVQLGDDGTSKMVDPGEGITPLAPGEVSYDKGYGTKAGQMGAERVGSASGDMQQAEDSIALIDSILDDPSLSDATGWQANFPTVYAETRDVEAKVQQLGGQAFLQAIQQMKGLGALSENEGKAATSAIARLQLNQSDDGFRESLQELRAIMERGREKARSILSGRDPGARGQPGAEPAPSPVPASGGSSSMRDKYGLD